MTQNGDVNLEIAMALLATLIGSGIFLSAVWDICCAHLSRNWPQVPGIIVVSDLQRSNHSDGGLMYRPEVTYRYCVDGSEIIANRTRFGGRVELSWSAPAVRTVRKYPVGSEVVVYYNPNDPADSVLEPGPGGILFAGAAFGALFAAIGVCALPISW
ncbi:MAG: hypothetical protein JWO97_4776 [Acidobacteria bacterium]|nr:hypothetical protein [Acidobacteriota bacterium]